MIENIQNIAVTEVIDGTESNLQVIGKYIAGLTKDEKGLDELMKQFDDVCESYGEAIRLGRGDSQKKLKLYRLRDTSLHMYLHSVSLGVIKTSDVVWVEKHMPYSLCKPETSYNCINQVANTFSADELALLLDEEHALSNVCANLDQIDIVQTIRDLLYIIAQFRKDADNVA